MFRQSCYRKELLINKPLHLVLGDSAAGSLKVACMSHGLPGNVIGIRDDLSHGPLDDGPERLNYMRAFYGEDGDWMSGMTDAFDSWREVIESIGHDKPEAIVIWRGENVSELTFLAMACSQLRKVSAPLFQVIVTDEEGLPYVAIRMPEQLVALYPARIPLTNSDRSDLGKEFERIRRKTGLLRRWDNGEIIGIPSDQYDRLLEESCSTDWTLAAPVVGAAMARCDKNNMMSDLFFFSRLRLLIDAGRIEADGSPERLLDFNVRLAQVV